VSTAAELGWWGVLIAVAGGAIRVSTPYLFVSLGETLTEKSGRVNLGLEGTLVMGAMSGYGVAYLTGSPWLGVLVAGGAGALIGLVHGLVCNLPRVNDIAVGIALFLLGTGLAFSLGKPFIEPTAPRLPHLALGAWSDYPQIRSALEINALFVVGAVLAPLLRWGLRSTRWGLVLRTVGDNADAARALGYSVERVRTAATMAGGFLAGVGGSFLSLYYPGTWNEGLSSGQGLMAVTLVIFARWNPVACFWVSLLFGAATALGPALQSIGIGANYYLYSAAPYALTLGLLIWSSSPRQALVGAPGELSISR
jgi:simple sugar transport system permease protein